MSPLPVQKDIVERDGKYCVLSATTGRSFGCYASRAEARARLAQVESYSKALAVAVAKRGGVDTPQKCHYCKDQATHALIWAEGAAYIPTCPMHHLNAIHALVGNGYGEPDGEVELPAKKAAADCPTCKGTGTIRGGNMECPDCGGTGLLKHLSHDQASHGNRAQADASPAAAADQQGVMVALYMPRAVAEAMNVPDGEPPDMLHITMCYLGALDEGEVQAAKDQLEGIVAAVAAAQPADLLEFTVTGSGRFAPADGASPEPSPCPFYLSVEPGPEIRALRDAVTGALDQAGIPWKGEHAFAPHITLAYVDLLDDDPARVAAPMTFGVNQLSLSYGPDRCDFPLGPGEEPAAEEQFLQVGEPFLKSEELRFTLAPVYSPGVTDAHGEFVRSAVLQKAFWGYFEKSREIHLQHADGTKAGDLVELVAWPFPVKAALQIPGEPTREIELPAGTEYAGIVWEPVAWELVKQGKLRGLSMGGRARKVYADFSS
jgi:2'-5' RNA ligase